jgi:hypothetical protein
VAIAFGVSSASSACVRCGALTCGTFACALYLAGDPTRISFLTFDRRRKTVADGLGFVG